MRTTPAPMLEAEDLSVTFETGERFVPAVRDVSLEVRHGEVLAIVGESGSGKSVTAKALMGLIHRDEASVSGRIWLGGEQVDHLPVARRQTGSGGRLSLVFQDALGALNPSLTIASQMVETIRVHQGLSSADARRRAEELLSSVGIPNAAERLADYPHQFSGGMRQRVLIAQALALEPLVLIADEPTTALDVTVQAQLLELFQRLCHDEDMGLVIITHDMGVVARIADTVAVMYAGRIVERGPVDHVMRSPAHPYTLGLLKSIPRIDSPGRRLDAIAGKPPAPEALPPGCPFHPRCEFAHAECISDEPHLLLTAAGHEAACFYTDEVSDLVQRSHH